MLKLTKKIFRKIQLFIEGKASLAELKPDEIKLISRIKKKRLTYLVDKRLVHIVRRCKQTERNGIKGIYVEAGCALGGSAILISSVKNINRPLKVYDVFGMIPPPSGDDPADVHARYETISTGKSLGIGGNKYYGYEDDLYGKVISNFKSFGIIPEEHNVHLIKGLVQDTMNINEPVAFAHIDVDWYEPVKICLERIFPYLSLGGYIILDDYRDWGGCRKATDEYLQTILGEYELSENEFGSVSIKRVSFK